MFGVLYYIMHYIIVYQLCWIGLRENHGTSTAPLSYRGSCKFLRIYYTIQVWESQTSFMFSFHMFSLGGHDW